MFHKQMDQSDPVMLSYVEDLLVEQRGKNKHEEVPAEVLALMRDPLPGEEDPLPVNAQPEEPQVEEGFLFDILNDAWNKRKNNNFSV